MKKIIIAAVAMFMALAVNAASVAWQVTSATADQKDYLVYVFASEVASNYATFDALIADTISTAGTIAEVSGRTGKTYMMTSALTGQSNSLGDSLYAVVIAGSDAKTYIYGKLDASNFTYNPDNQESSPGVLSFATSALTSSVG